MESGFDSIDCALEDFKEDKEFTKKIISIARRLATEVEAYYNEQDNMYDDYRYNHDEYDGSARERNLKRMLENVRDDRRSIIELFAEKDYDLVFYDCDDSKFY